MKQGTRVVILNGVGSAGKGSIAKALQAIASRPFLHVEMDAFLAMLPNSYFSHPDGLIFETIEEGGKPSVVIETGVVAERLLSGMRRAVAALAAAGNDLIVGGWRACRLPVTSCSIRRLGGWRLRTARGA
jgi:chloramphenicol 3-O phosphotransferase